MTEPDPNPYPIPEMTRAQARHYENRWWGDTSFTAMRDRHGCAVVRMFYNDGDADVLFYFGPFKTIEAAQAAARFMDEKFDGQHWDVEGPFENDLSETNDDCDDETSDESEDITDVETEEKKDKGSK